MTDKPKRKWLQLHLLTMIVLVFVAGGCIGINLRRYNLRRSFDFEQTPHGRVLVSTFNIGYPFKAYDGFILVWEGPNRPTEIGYVNPHYVGITGNLALSFVPLTVAWVLCESLILRLEVRKL